MFRGTNYLQLEWNINIYNCTFVSETGYLELDYDEICHQLYSNLGMHYIEE